MARLCPNCRQVAVDEFAGGGYVCANCGEQWDTLQALATRTREAGLHRRGSAAGRLEERRRREEEAARARELAEAEEEEGEQAAREAGEATRWPGRIRNRREAERQAREEEARRREQRRIGAEDVRARSRLAERRARGERQAREHIPGFITDARGMGLIAQGLGWFIGGLIISALLGSVLLFIAFLCWAVNSIIRMPADPIRQRMDRIRNRYNQLLQRATSERGREFILRQMRNETQIEAVMAQIVRARANNPAEAEEMNRQWQRTFKAGLNVLAFAFLVIGVVFTGMPGAGIFGLIISFVAYFVLGGRQEGRPQ